jgi:hypothetical protein
VLSLSDLGFKFFRLIPLGIKGLAGLFIVDEGAILMGILYPGEEI